MRAEAREPLDVLVTRGQALRLLVGDHLQAMLDRAQMLVGERQVVHRFLRHPPVALQFDEHVERARAAQLHAPPAEDQLLRLHEELDLANAAASELHVVTRDRDIGEPAHGVDLALHRVNVGNGGVIEILAPDEGREIGQEFCAHRTIAGDGTRLDEGGALPVLPEGFVIVEGGRQRDRDACRARVRPQAKVDAQHITFARALLQQTRKRLRHADEDRPCINAVAQDLRGRVEEDDEIDVARIIQLARAMLAERKDHVAAILFGIALDR